MPGDVFHDSVEIRNTTEHAAEIFFRTSPECKSVKDQEFLKKLKLVITMNDKKLYSGDLLAASLNKAVSLGEFSSGEKGNMRFEVTVPAELDNLYALRAANVKWIFSVEEDQETADTSPVPRRNGRKEATERASGNNSSLVRTTPVKTGDESPVILFALMAGMALLTCSLTLWKGRTKKIEKKNDRCMAGIDDHSFFSCGFGQSCSRYEFGISRSAAGTDRTGGRRGGPGYSGNRSAWGGWRCRFRQPCHEPERWRKLLKKVKINIENAEQ